MRADPRDLFGGAGASGGEAILEATAAAAESHLQLIAAAAGSRAAVAGSRVVSSDHLPPANPIAALIDALDQILNPDDYHQEEN